MKQYIIVPLDNNIPDTGNSVSIEGKNPWDALENANQMGYLDIPYGGGKEVCVICPNGLEIYQKIGRHF